MNTYTFNFNKKNTNSSNKRTNNTSYINSLIRSNVAKIAPYIVDDDYIPTFTTPKKKTVIDITIKKPRKNTSTMAIFDADYISDFEKAVNYLATSYKNLDSYDFKINGVPVKIFDDGEIQIGYELFNLTNLATCELTPKTKKTIIDIYISLNK